MLFNVPELLFNNVEFLGYSACVFLTWQICVSVYQSVTQMSTVRGLSFYLLNRSYSSSDGGLSNCVGGW